MAAADLNFVLWRERELLDSLLFFLEIEQLMLAEGRTRWLGRTSTEIDRTTAALRETEILRAVEADRVAEGLLLGADPSLAALAEAATEPWRTIFHDQRAVLLHLTTEITAKASANRAMLAATERSARERLLSPAIPDQPHDYSPPADLVRADLARSG